MQTWQWGEIKSAVGWASLPFVWRDDQNRIVAAALILERNLKIGPITTGLKVLYIPRGPLMDWSDQGLCKRILDDLEELCRKRHALFLKMDPEIILGEGIPESPEAVESEKAKSVLEMMHARGWNYSDEQIQFKNTAWLDLSADEETWLSRMKPKARYNLRLSQKKGVNVRLATLNDLPTLYRMYKETSVRDGFVIRPERYYRQVWQLYMQADMCQALIAEVDGEAIAGVVLMYFAGRSWYLYGMSTENHRDKMPNYLLQWEAMRLLKSKGCQFYDLWGAPDVFNESDSMWGVFRFKDGLGAKVIRTPGAWDYAPWKWVYTLYTRMIPNVLNIMRAHGKARAKHELS
ncbi:MAG: peptidoglycan bridge formation glycyltransferase FemA/FemB family protein [Anaerolineae bacterium]|nr:peptidoglycan bridge formation glycyltransferase FemA/FemB family protein [Anaerolineae bacterium]